MIHFHFPNPLHDFGYVDQPVAVGVQSLIEVLLRVRDVGGILEGMMYTLDRYLAYFGRFSMQL